MEIIERQAMPQIASEIARASRAMLERWEATEEVSADPDHDKRIREIMDGMTTRAVRTFAARIISAKSGPPMERKDFAATLSRLAFRFIALEAYRRRITAISETTRESIVAQITRGQAQGLGVAEIARGIADVLPVRSVARGALIARTETHGAANYGADAGARETGLTLRKQWVAAFDERTRESHAEADGQTVGMDDQFRVGGEYLSYPGDVAGGPENTINCRCAVVHVVVE